MKYQSCQLYSIIYRPNLEKLQTRKKAEKETES